MKKNILLTLGIICCFALAYGLDLTLVEKDVFDKIALREHYLFHFIFSTAICALFLGLNQHKKWKEQLGFIYLGTFLLKMIIFASIFGKFLQPSKSTENIEVFLMLTPLFIGLFLEVFVISRLLNKANPK